MSNGQSKEVRSGRAGGSTIGFFQRKQKRREKKLLYFLIPARISTGNNITKQLRQVEER